MTDYTKEVEELRSFLEKQGFNVESGRGDRVLMKKVLESGEALRLMLIRERSETWNYSFRSIGQVGDVGYRVRPASELIETWEARYRAIVAAGESLRQVGGK